MQIPVRMKDSPKSFTKEERMGRTKFYTAKGVAGVSSWEVYKP